MNSIVNDDNYTLKNFVQLSEDELRKVLMWRNHPMIRQNMDTSHEILWEDHLKFVNSLGNAHQKLYYLVEFKNKDLGVIYYNDLDKKDATLGLYLAPNIHGGGKGVVLELIALIHFFKMFKEKKLIGFIKHENIDSQALQPFFGFKLSKKDDKYNYFELGYDAWLSRGLNIKNLNKELINYARKNKRNP